MFIVLTTAVPAVAQAGRFDVREPTLARAIIALARQAGVSIATDEAGAAGVRVHPVRGASNVDAALRMMLANTGYEAVKVGTTTYAVRRIRRAAPPPPPKRPPRSAPAPQDERSADIIVTATKMAQPLPGYSGTAQVLTFDEAGLRNAEARGTAAVVEQLPVMASTGLGPGRDKLFVRGIADSSFTGTTQATIGQYFGEVRLNYNAPDPSLALYDLARVELLEGPQATLYGAGSLGGILRLVPNPPVRGRTEASVLSSLSIAANGRLGSELAGTLNLPIGRDSALRAVAYTGTTPGSVDDPLRGLHAVGRSHQWGGRIMTDTNLGDGWSVEAGAAFQRIEHLDARYAEGADDPPRRASTIAQPAANSFALGEITLRKRWESGLELTSASAVVKNDLTARYDLSPVAAGVRSDTRNDASVASNETRVSRSTGRNTGWVVGFHGVSSTNREAITLDRGRDRLASTRIGAGVVDLALFGQATIDILARWTATLGGRLSYSEVRILGALPDLSASADLSPVRRAALRGLPSAALAWHPRNTLTLYGRYQRGYRVGGLTIIPFVDPENGERVFSIGSFRPDTVDMVEAGLRFGSGRTPLAGSVVLSGTHWRDIQADLLDSYGPYTANVGNARILGLEGTFAWRPGDSFELTGSLFAALSSSKSQQYSTDSYRLALPNIAPLTLRLDAERRFRLGSDKMMSTHAQLRYVGRSEIGVGATNLLRQGDYVELGAGMDMRFAGNSLFVDVDNLLNVRGNRFGMGNPYTAYTGNQRIPLQPRTIRVGIRRSFP